MQWSTVKYIVHRPVSTTAWFPMDSLHVNNGNCMCSSMSDQGFQSGGITADPRLPPPPPPHPSASIQKISWLCWRQAIRTYFPQRLPDDIFCLHSYTVIGGHSTRSPVDGKAALEPLKRIWPVPIDTLAYQKENCGQRNTKDTFLC